MLVRLQAQLHLRKHASLGCNQNPYIRPDGCVFVRICSAQGETRPALPTNHRLPLLAFTAKEVSPLALEQVPVCLCAPRIGVCSACTGQPRCICRECVTAAVNVMSHCSASACQQCKRQHLAEPSDKHMHTGQLLNVCVCMCVHVCVPLMLLACLLAGRHRAGCLGVAGTPQPHRASGARQCAAKGAQLLTHPVCSRHVSTLRTPVVFFSPRQAPWLDC